VFLKEIGQKTKTEGDEKGVNGVIRLGSLVLRLLAHESKHFPE
jgi:hypothetical protein